MHIDELYFRIERLRKHAEELGELLDAAVIVRCESSGTSIRGIDDVSKKIIRDTAIYFTVVIEKELSDGWATVFDKEYLTIEESDTALLSLICGAKLAKGIEV